MDTSIGGTHGLESGHAQATKAQQRRSAMSPHISIVLLRVCCSFGMTVFRHIISVITSPSPGRRHPIVSHIAAAQQQQTLAIPSAIPFIISGIFMDNISFIVLCIMQHTSVACCIMSSIAHSAFMSIDCKGKPIDMHILQERNNIPMQHACPMVSNISRSIGCSGSMHKQATSFILWQIDLQAFNSSGHCAGEQQLCISCFIIIMTDF